MGGRMLLKDRLMAAMEAAVRGSFELHCPEMDIEAIIEEMDFAQYDPVKTKAKKDAVSPEVRASLPFDPAKCHGRIWGNGYGGQCSCKPSKDGSGDFCKRHDSSQKFGVFGGPFPEGQPWKKEVKLVPGEVEEKEAMEDGAGVGEFQKKGKKKKGKKKAEESPELVSLKEKYEGLYGRKARGPKVNNVEWLEMKIGEKEDEVRKLDEDAAEALEEKVNAMEKNEEELDEDTEDIRTWNYEGVEYLRNFGNGKILNENEEEVGTLNDDEEVVFLDGFREMHMNDGDYEDPASSGDESSEEE